MITTTPLHSYLILAPFVHDPLLPALYFPGVAQTDFQAPSG